MTPPSRADIAVALEALDDDAAQWVRIADDLRQAERGVQRQRLDPAAFGFAGGAIAEAYAGLLARTAALLIQGAQNGDDVAGALGTAAAAYAAEERAGVHRLRGVY